MVLKKAAEGQGHEVLSATNGGEALEVLRGRTDVDAVLLDLLMPDMDGFEVLSRLREDDSLRHIPVIVISGVDDLNSAMRSVELGAADYLPKPVNPVLLRARLNATLAEGRLSRIEADVTRLSRALEAALEGGSAASTLDELAAGDDATAELARLARKLLER